VTQGHTLLVLSRARARRPHVGTGAFLSGEAGPGVNTGMMQRVNGGAYPAGGQGLGVFMGIEPRGGTGACLNREAGH
jgi:hypothetical protein